MSCAFSLICTKHYFQLRGLKVMFINQWIMNVMTSACVTLLVAITKYLTRNHARKGHLFALEFMRKV